MEVNVPICPAIYPCCLLGPLLLVECDEEHVFKDVATKSWGERDFLPLSELNAPGSGFLKDDVLELRVEVKVKKEQRFQLDTGEAARGSYWLPWCPMLGRHHAAKHPPMPGRVQAASPPT